MVKGFKPINTCKWENGRRGLPKQEELMCWRASVETWFSFSWWANNNPLGLMIANEWLLMHQPKWQNNHPKKLWELTYQHLTWSISNGRTGAYYCTFSSPILSKNISNWTQFVWSKTISSCEKLEEEQRWFFSGLRSRSAGTGTGCVGEWSWILDGATFFCTTTAQRHREQNAYYQQPHPDLLVKLHANYSRTFRWIPHNFHI